jgi:6,7-dimethyl-8-ribityllumazine synthase
MRTIKAPMDGSGLRVGIVCGRFNDLITDRLLSGALDTLERHGVADDAITVVWVPGSFEMPVTAKALAARDDIDAVLTLGAVIRGATGHYDHVAGQAAAGIARAAMDTGTPVIFGVLTTETLEQALDRAGAKVGNKGSEAAATAIEMVHVLRAITS